MTFNVFKVWHKPSWTPTKTSIFSSAAIESTKWQMANGKWQTFDGLSYEYSLAFAGVASTKMQFTSIMNTIDFVLWHSHPTIDRRI